MSTEHCFPQPDGIPTCEGPVGSGSAYGACNDPSECQAALNCIDTGDIFLSPCCLRWCKTDANCNALESCVFLATSVYVGATEYGVCYDGGGGC